MSKNNLTVPIVRIDCVTVMICDIITGDASAEVKPCISLRQVVYASSIYLLPCLSHVVKRCKDGIQSCSVSSQGFLC
jgi:hypothetical protein